ncbi:MAG: nuclear transport factor 2 family protein [Acidimicrobiia bacterium]
MAHPNAEMIERAYAAFAEGDIATIMSFWTDDIVWHQAGDHPLAGDHEGKEGAAGFLGGIAQRTGGTFRAELQHVLADDEMGYSLQKGTATKDGEQIEAWAILSYVFEDGKIKEIWTFDYDQSVSNRVFS